MSKTTNKIETDTWAFKTIEGWKQAATEAGLVLNYDPLGQNNDFPPRAVSQLEQLRKLEAIAKGEVQKVVTSIHRQLVQTVDKNGKPKSVEYLTYGGEYRVKNHRGVPYAREYVIGKYNRPDVVPNSAQKYNPDTGEPLHDENILSGNKPVYWIEVPADLAKRKKLIDSIIGEGYPDSIQFYYKELSHTNGEHKRDGSFSYDDFVNCSISELKNMSAKGGGSRNSGYYRDKENKLRDRNDNLV